MCSRENWKNLQSSTKVENSNHLGTWEWTSLLLLVFLFSSPSLAPVMWAFCFPQIQSFCVFLRDRLVCFLMISLSSCLILSLLHFSFLCIIKSLSLSFSRALRYLLTAVILFSLFVLTDSHLNSFIVMLLVLEEEVEINTWFQCVMFNQKFYTKL